MLNLTYTYALKLTTQQSQTYEAWLETSRRVWNFALAERKDWYNSRSCRIDACSLKHEYIIPADTPRPTFASQCKALTQARKTNPNLNAAHSQMLQQVLRRLEKAFIGMWESGRGFPRFKKLGRMRSLLFPQLGVNPIQENQVKLPGVGWVKMRLSRPIPCGFVAKQAQVVKRASGWYVMLTLQADVDVPNTIPHGQAVGIDLGLISFLATSTGEQVARPRFFVDLQRKLKLLQQRASHKKLGSNNWRKAQAKIARLHEHIYNTRKDFHFKLAHQLCDQAGMIFAEDLNLKAWAKGLFSKHTLDAGFGNFLSVLEWICWKRGVYFAKVNPDGTSQTCPNCNHHTGKKELSERVHRCGECGLETDRDTAAAMVVMQRGLAAVGHTVKMLGEGLSTSSPVTQESPFF
ncbi:RNA-guided endonuclease InsQ/TnpB family protein [Gloeocapsopsis dulcis]|uniref:Transposase n=1 Tax=Gloeocapsopsis dulcis AAB1 = 1H9 TaxID=1433147 RepID=A0A6N8FXL4_9CHRO|nr:RNA-guided endonuclease TnpB family protein [Gloeocapsopsis dulcis]MUL37579.1 transposase [Gloeocapsopsis dulcis AAB1 = 1H9]WNN87991.1 transposase [Gloeocapsopsis dulcis]